MAGIQICGEIRLDQIPDDAIKEFRCKTGKGASIKIKIQQMKKPDQWGNDCFICINWPREAGSRNDYIGKAKFYKTADVRPEGQQPSKNKWANTEPEEAEYEEPF